MNNDGLSPVQGRPFNFRANQKPDTLSGSDENILREFVSLGRSLDGPIGRLIELAMLVKAVFMTKPRGVPIIFDGRKYTTFDAFVDAHMPVTARTMRRWLAKEGKTQTKYSSAKRFWLTPTEMYEQLNKEFGFDEDVCPYPKPEGYDSLTVPWGWVNYCNPPFRRRDGFGHGPMAWVKKALEEQKLGKTTVLTLPIYNSLHTLLEAGAEFRPAGRVRWLEVDSKEPWSGGVATVICILRGKQIFGEQLKNKGNDWGEVEPKDEGAAE
jgi:hypothetical protein